MSTTFPGHDGDWSDQEPSEAVRALVMLAGGTLLPMMLAVSQALGRGEQVASYEFEGTRITGIARPYPRNCWLWLKQAFAALPDRDRESLRPLLQEAGFWDALAFASGEAERVPPFVMV